MRAERVCAILGAVLLGAMSGTGVSAQDDNPVTLHVGHVAEGFNGTPDGQGLLPAARAEAEIVVRHATLAAEDTTDLDAMQLHVGHVLHAVDPAVMAQGPGLGYGMKPAAEAAARHIEMAREAEGASRRVRDYGRRVATSARNTVERADEIIALGEQIREATDASEAAPLVGELKEIADILIEGIDENNDGGVGWRRGEGGLEQARQNLNVLREAASESAGSGGG